jgi:hypothetical protein
MHLLGALALVAPCLWQNIEVLPGGEQTEVPSRILDHIYRSTTSTYTLTKKPLGFTVGTASDKFHDATLKVKVVTPGLGLEIQTGDLLVAIDGSDVRKLKPKDIARALKAATPPFELTIERPLPHVYVVGSPAEQHVGPPAQGVFTWTEGCAKKLDWIPFPEFPDGVSSGEKKKWAGKPPKGSVLVFTEGMMWKSNQPPYSCEDRDTLDYKCIGWVTRDIENWKVKSHNNPYRSFEGNERCRAFETIFSPSPEAYGHSCKEYTKLLTFDSALNGCLEDFMAEQSPLLSSMVR